jgi:hypothetical protein
MASNSPKPSGDSPPPEKKTEKPGPSNDPDGKKSFGRGFRSKSPPR